MNFKDLITPIVLAVMASFALQYLFFGGKNGAEVEATFIAPKDRREYKPLNVEVDFFDSKRPAQAKITDIETEWGHVQFSTDGASLESIDFKRELDGKIKSIRTIFPVTETERENRCFLVALNEKTPFYYALVSSQECDDSYQLVYLSDTDDCSIKKTFIINKERSKIDLMVDVTAKKGKTAPIEPRIFYPAPLMPEIRENDAISSIVVDQTAAFSKKGVGQVELRRGWFSPELFGSDSRYFIHSLIADNDKFAVRAYYKLEDRDRLFSVLEGPSVETRGSWTLSFYFGPKELDSLTAVDPRLEKTLDYSGWFAPIAKIMLYLLRWFYKYLYNYGLAIMAITLLFQLLLLPLSLRNNEEKWKKQQAEYQRKLAIINQRFANDPDRLSLEKAELMRKEGLPGLGCVLPLLLQIPLFFALSRVLSCSFELYQAPMLWIPDLSARDPYFILPALVVIVMLAPDGKVDPQQRMSKMLMAIIFGAITTSFSAGLVLYIFLGRIFGFIQARVMKYFKLV
jgi:YidC/Oxa1 family membrane protein insertase